MMAKQENFRQVLQYIGELLRTHDCVIIPGLGAFVAAPAPAFVKNNTLYPPQKHVEFNSGIKSNDGLLAAHIEKRESISTAEANHTLSQFTGFLRDSLEDGNHIHFKNVGTLFLNKERRIQFKEENAVNLLKSAYGLPGLHEISSAKPETHLPSAKSYHGQTSWKANGWKNWMFVPLTLFVLGGTVAGLEFNNIKVGSAFLNLFKPKPIPAKPVATVVPPPAPVPAPPPPPAWLEGTTPKGARFFIVAGCYADMLMAEIRLKELQDRGYDARIIGKRKGLIAVAYRGYKTKKEALYYLPVIQDREDLSAWITKN